MCIHLKYLSLLISVMYCGSLLLFQELSPLWIALFKSVLGPAVLPIITVFLKSFSLEWEYLSCLPSLCLLDVIHVGPAEGSKAGKDEDKPAFALVVETIRLVPIWELTHVLMSIVGFVTSLGVSWNFRVYVVDRCVGHRVIDTSETMWVHEVIHSPGGHY